MKLASVKKIIINHLLKIVFMIVEEPPRHLIQKETQKIKMHQILSQLMNTMNQIIKNKHLGRR